MMPGGLLASGARSFVLLREPAERKKVCRTRAKSIPSFSQDRNRKNNTAALLLIPVCMSRHMLQNDTTDRVIV